LRHLFGALFDHRFGRRHLGADIEAEQFQSLNNISFGAPARRS
jgi:hypothetical protein